MSVGAQRRSGLVCGQGCTFVISLAHQRRARATPPATAAGVRRRRRPAARSTPPPPTRSPPPQKPPGPGTCGRTKDDLICLVRGQYEQCPGEHKLLHKLHHSPHKLTCAAALLQHGLDMSNECLLGTGRMSNDRVALLYHFVGTRFRGGWLYHFVGTRFRDGWSEVASAE